MVSLMEEQILEYIRQLRTTTTPSITTKATRIEASTTTTATTTISINNNPNQELKFCFDNVACIYLVGGGSFTMMLFKVVRTAPISNLQFRGAR